MSRTTHLLTSSLAIVGLCALAVGCGSGEESSTAAPAISGAPPTATVQQDSAAARLCIDLVKTEQYAKAIEPCELALQDNARGFMISPSSKRLATGCMLKNPPAFARVGTRFATPSGSSASRRTC